jgi:poly-gamma-glutamate synthesis protein (capsule biosynthesis protein)
VELERVRPDVRIVNLETAVTVSADRWPEKRIHYRMHPANVPCLMAAKIDCCVLANNHVMDWGHAGLEETVAALHSAGIRTAGAGLNDAEASAPAVIQLAGGARLLISAFAVENSGEPRAWIATPDQRVSTA